MNKRFLTLICLSLSWLPGAGASPSVELKVQGMIKPAACELIFANGGTVDVGVISKRLLNQQKRTLLPDEKINFSIICDAPARVSLDLKDHRAGTAAANASLKPLPFLFGLGTVDARNVGAYTLSFDEEATADQKPMRMVMAENQTDWGWSNSFLMPNRRHSWTMHQSGYLPTPFSTLTGVIILAPAVAPARDLPTQDEIALDGLASFELNYL
ncbi:DUF1120 domain-containing protein [Herbaspirillum sp. alder98]|uniref:DUF1120 domain-containing protein n=1 Tax=Herbaspirillum sp. alder98 TaxID=2913096 RepID=UPI001CD9025F|nr:DUF1120 domain-containing protein [Herbaspirillum sp. alder98]MCA1322548.1 DUF1120 domain-containing protein [Herbaspirillum sp. alder98]